MNIKKLIALLLILVLTASLLLPASAEEKAAAPIALEAFKAAYEAVVIANADEDCTITWKDAAQDEKIVSYATVNDAFISLLVLHDGELATECAVVLNASLTTDNVLSFLSMAGYGVAARLVADGTDMQSATDNAMKDLMALFSSLTQEGDPLREVCGLPVGMSISPLSENVWQFYFVLPLSAPQTAE